MQLHSHWRLNHLPVIAVVAEDLAFQKFQADLEKQLAQVKATNVSSSATFKMNMHINAAVLQTASDPEFFMRLVLEQHVSSPGSTAPSSSS